jgi:hypothetical protein
MSEEHVVCLMSTCLAANRGRVRRRDTNKIKHVWSHNFKQSKKKHASPRNRERTSQVEKGRVEELVSR